MNDDSTDGYPGYVLCNGLWLSHNSQDQESLAMRQKVNNQLLIDVSCAVSAIYLLDDNTWTKSQLIHRIVHTFNEAVLQLDLNSRNWRNVVKSFITYGMETHARTFQSKPWFFEIDLVPVLTSAAWIILGETRIWFIPMNRQEIEDEVLQNYEDALDRVVMVKALWDASKATFPGQDVIINKVYTALCKTQGDAIDKASGNIFGFMRCWINDFMAKCWYSLQNPKNILTEESVTRLFNNLVSPFGDDHPFTCIPGQSSQERLYQQENRRHRRIYISFSVSQMFEPWEEVTTKRRRTTSSVQDVIIVKEEQQEIQACDDIGLSEAEKEHCCDSSESSIENLRCRDCASRAECIGQDGDRLVIQILDTVELGDTYCSVCWHSFLETSPHLEGMFEDDRTRY